MLGGSSEKLSGIINTSSEEFQGLTDSIRENGDIISNEGIANANAFNLALGKLGDGFGQIATQVGTAFIPLLTDIIEGMTELWQEVEGPVLFVLGILTDVLGGALKSAFQIIGGAINIVAGILTGDFSQAWRGVQQIAQGVMNAIITVYNNTIALIPGVSKIDMLEFADNIEIAADAVEDLGTAATTSAETTATALGSTVTAVETSATKIRDAERQLTIDLAEEGKKRLADALAVHKQGVQDRKDAQDAEYDALVAHLDGVLEARAESHRSFFEFEADRRRHAQKVADDEEAERQAALGRLSMFIDAQNAAETGRRDDFAAHIFALADAEKQGDSRRYAGALKAFEQFVADNALQQGAELQAYIAHYEALAAAAGVGVSNIINELSRLPTGIGGDGRPDVGFGSTGGVAGGSSKARPAPGPITLDPNQGAILDVNGYTFRTSQTGRNFYHLQFYPSRFSDVQAWLAERNRPALGPLQNAQHGGIVLPRTGGTPVNVGEAGRAEAIIPLPDLAALAGNLMAGVGGGMGIGGGARRWLRWWQS